MKREAQELSGGTTEEGAAMLMKRDSHILSHLALT